MTNNNATATEACDEAFDDSRLRGAALGFILVQPLLAVVYSLMWVTAGVDVMWWKDEPAYQNHGALAAVVVLLVAHIFAPWFLGGLVAGRLHLRANRPPAVMVTN